MLIIGLGAGLAWAQLEMIGIKVGYRVAVSIDMRSLTDVLSNFCIIVDKSLYLYF